MRRASRPARTRRPWRQARAREHDPPRPGRAAASRRPRRRGARPAASLRVRVGATCDRRAAPRWAAPAAGSCLWGGTSCASVCAPAGPTARAPAGGAAELACAACLCDVSAEVATRMACGHAFCDECWRQHLGVQIREGRSRRLVCMGVRCGAVCDEEQARPQAPCGRAAEQRRRAGRRNRADGRLRAVSHFLRPDQWSGACVPAHWVCQSPSRVCLPAAGPHLHAACASSPQRAGGMAGAPRRSQGRV